MSEPLDSDVVSRQRSGSEVRRNQTYYMHRHHRWRPGESSGWRQRGWSESAPETYTTKYILQNFDNSNLVMSFGGDEVLRRRRRGHRRVPGVDGEVLHRRRGGAVAAARRRGDL